MLIVGLIWALLLPLVVAVLVLSVGADTRAIIAYIFIAILWIASIRLFSAGIYGCKRNKKAVILVINEETLDALFYGKHNEMVREISFSNICDFSFSSNGTKFNKSTEQYEIQPNSTGLISFALKDNKSAVFELRIYDADVAAKMILAKLDDDQIDSTNNELARDGTYTPKG